MTVFSAAPASVRVIVAAGERCLPRAGLLVVAGLLLAGCQNLTGASLATTGGLAAGPAFSLAVDPADGSLLKAEGELFRSADQGQTWAPVPVPPGLRSQSLKQVATSAAAPSSLYVGGPGAGIVRSDDRGQTWRPIGSGLPSQAVVAFAVHSFRPDTLFAWIDGQGLFRTEDGGGRWQKMDFGPPIPALALVHSTLEGSMNTGWVYAATRDGPYLSMD